MQDVISFSSGISACEKCSNWTQALHLLRDLKAVYYPKNLKIVGVGRVNKQEISRNSREMMGGGFTNPDFFWSPVAYRHRHPHHGHSLTFTASPA